MVWRQGKYTVTRDHWQWGLSYLVPGDRAVTYLERESLVEKFTLRRLYPLWKDIAYPKLPYGLNLLSLWSGPGGPHGDHPAGIWWRATGSAPRAGRRWRSGEPEPAKARPPANFIFPSSWFPHLLFILLYLYPLCLIQPPPTFPFHNKKGKKHQKIVK